MVLSPFCTAYQTQHLQPILKGLSTDLHLHFICTRI